MHRARGFTLIELMIVMVIIGILAAIAIPSYTEYVRKAHRADAQATLTQLAYWMERQYTRDSRYDTEATETLPDSMTQNESYTFDFDKRSANEFTLKATLKDSQSDNGCNEMTLDQAGRQEPKKCW